MANDMPMPMRLMLVDDHYLVRLGLSSVIALEPDMTVCAEAATGHHAIELFREHQPDVTLMDLRLPDLSGTAAIRAIRAR
jgi:two-component system NarL family response regulator